MTCPSCALLHEAAADPYVAAVAHRLRDELTVFLLRRDTPRPVLERLSRGATKHRLLEVRLHRAKSAVHDRISAELLGGPLRLAELAAWAYPPAADPGQRRLNHQAARSVLAGMIARGEAVRVGHGWYALPWRRDRMRLATPARCAAVLTDTRLWTVTEIAARFDVRPATAAKWVERASDAGYDVRKVRVERPGKRWVYGYRIEPGQRSAVRA